LSKREHPEHCSETWPVGTIVSTVETFDEMERYALDWTIRAWAVPTTPEQFAAELNMEHRVMESRRHQRRRQWLCS
jgi:hypothetical protein